MNKNKSRVCDHADSHAMQPGQINKALNSKPGENLQTVAIDKEKYMLNNNRQNTFAFEQGLSTQFLYFAASFNLFTKTGHFLQEGKIT